MKELERHMRIFNPETVEVVAKSILAACVKRENSTLLFRHHLSTKEVLVHIVDSKTANALITAGIFRFPNTFVVNYETVYADIVAGGATLDDMKDEVYYTALRHFILPVMK